MASSLLPGGSNSQDRPASTIIWIRRLLAFLVVLVILYQIQEYSFLRQRQNQEVDNALRGSVKDLYPPSTLPPHSSPQDLQQPPNQQSPADNPGVGDSNVAQQESPKPLPRIFDIILLNNEMDQLEVRLGELHKVVDVFVIVESQKTFSGRDKPLFYRTHQHEERFAQYKNKILHLIAPSDMTDAVSQRMATIAGHGWEYETFVRNKAIEMLIDTFRPSQGDWLLLSDLDEIPKPEVLAKIKANPDSISTKPLTPRNAYRQKSVMQRQPGMGFLRLDCDFYYYSYEYKHRGNWIGPVMARFEDPAPSTTVEQAFVDDQTQLDDEGMLVFDKPFWHDYANIGYRMRMQLRHEGDVHVVPQACWHCSWCFANIADVKRKAASYSHREHADSHFMEQDWILQHFREGIDLFERNGENYDYIQNNKDVPAYVTLHREKFSYQLERKGKDNAGFIDVPVVAPKKEEVADKVEEKQ